MKGLFALVGAFLLLPGLMLGLQVVAGTEGGDGFGDLLPLILSIPMVTFGTISLFIAYSMNRDEEAMNTNQSKDHE